MNELILVTGGARSGKSDFAERLAFQRGDRDVTFIATAEAHDEDMAARIAAHRARRPAGWRTLEAPREVAEAIGDAPAVSPVILLDCLTLLASNVLLRLGEDPDGAAVEAALQREVTALLEAPRVAGGTLIVVTNEVGLGLVPPSRLGRVYRDALGRANRRLAERADRVFLMVSGLPLELKSQASPWPSGPDDASGTGG